MASCFLHLAAGSVVCPSFTNPVFTSTAEISPARLTTSRTESPLFAPMMDLLGCASLAVTAFLAVIGLIHALHFSYKAVFRYRSRIPDTSGKVHEITNLAEFDALLSTTSHLVVELYADWSSRCHTIAPVYSALASKYSRAGHISFARVNVEHGRALAASFRGSRLPAFILLSNDDADDVDSRGLGFHPSVRFIWSAMALRIRAADVGALEMIVRAWAHLEE